MVLVILPQRHRFQRNDNPTFLIPLNRKLRLRQRHPDLLALVVEYRVRLETSVCHLGTPLGYEAHFHGEYDPTNQL